MNVKYQIFVSSTYEDLKDERNEVIKACLNMGHIPVGMEMFNAADEEQWQVISRTIDQCDYYAVIVAHRYGSTMPDGLSFTEKEYDYAVDQGAPVLGFVIDPKAPWPSDRIDKDPICVQALQSFKSKVKQKMVRSWSDKSELQAHFAISLGTTININPRRGWVRAPEAGATDVVQTLSNLAEENARLRQALDEMRTSASSRDDIDDLIDWLNKEIDGRNGREFFIDLVKSSRSGNFKRGRFIDNTLRHVIDGGERDVRASGLSAALETLQVLGLIEPIQKSVDGMTVTALGRRVYTRLDLGRRAEPHF
jgi:Domain of unknown function (DUF4062)